MVVARGAWPTVTVDLYDEPSYDEDVDYSAYRAMSMAAVVALILGIISSLQSDCPHILLRGIVKDYW